MNFSASGLLAFTSANSSPEAKPPASGDNTGRAQARSRNGGDAGFGKALAQASRPPRSSASPRKGDDSAHAPDTPNPPRGSKPKNPAFPAESAAKGAEDAATDRDPNQLVFLIQQIMGGAEHGELFFHEGKGSAGARDFPPLNDATSDLMGLFRKLADEAGLMDSSTPFPAGKSRNPSPMGPSDAGSGLSALLSEFRQSLVGSPSEITGQVAGDFTRDAAGAVRTSHESLKRILKALIGLAESRSGQGSVSKGAAQGARAAQSVLDLSAPSEAGRPPLAPGAEASGKAIHRDPGGGNFSDGSYPAAGKASAAGPAPAGGKASGEAGKAAGDAVSAELKDLLKSAMSPAAKNEETGARQAMARGSAERGAPGTDTEAAARDGRMRLGQILHASAENPDKAADAGANAQSATTAFIGKPSDMEATVKASVAGKAGSSSAVLSEAGARPADAPAPPQPAGAQAEIMSENVQASSKQAAASFAKGLQSAENRVVSQVFVRLYAGVRQGSGNMTINMHPPELGSVKVRIATERGQLNVSLHPQNHQVVGILERHLPSLHQSLADQGIDIADMKVSVDDSGSEESRFADHEFEGSNDGSNGRRSFESEEDRQPEIAEQAPNPEAGGLSLRI